MIYKAKLDDADILTQLAKNMWHNHTYNELKSEFECGLKNKNAVFYISSENDAPIGFVQCHLRFDYVEGTSSCPVGYLEGIFILKEYRRKGYAKALIAECENWARQMGCVEFASDCELDNSASIELHQKLGFEVANKIVCFKKSLRFIK